MIYLFTALYDEAYPFLQYYKMKKEINSLPFEMYRCEAYAQAQNRKKVWLICAAKLRKKRHKRHFTRIFYTGIRFPKLRL